MDPKFKGLIWTKHSIARMRERGIKQSDAWATWNRPNNTRKGTTPGTWVYIRNFGDNRIEVVSKKNEEGDWVIVSVWSKYIVRTRRQTNIWKRIKKAMLS